MPFVDFFLFFGVARATEVMALKVNRVSLGKLVPRAPQDLPVQPPHQKLKR